MIQLSLFRDYKNNLLLYDAWHLCLWKYQPATLVISGKDDKIFIAAGAAPFLKDVKKAQVSLLNGGHFVPREKRVEAASIIKVFFRKNGI